MMNVEITLRRGAIPVWSYDEAFLRRFEAHLEANPEDGDVRPGGFYRRFLNAHKTIIGCVTKILGDDAIEPFTITIKVEGKKKVYPPGPVNY